MCRQIPLIAIVLASSAFLVFPRAAPAQKSAETVDVSAQQVRRSIEKGVSYLKYKQQPDGTWPGVGGQTGGVTTLCTLALLNCGVPPDDKSMQAALTYLRKLTPTTTYVTSLQTMVFCLAEPQIDLPRIQRNKKWLEENQSNEGLRRGSWAYPGKITGGDNSNSEFAVLALNEADRIGVAVADRTWQMTLDYWRLAQNGSDGSFGYYKSSNGETPGTGSMTCAGICSLMIASSRATSGDAESDATTIKCCGSQPVDDSTERIDRSLDWLKQRFSVQLNPDATSVRVARAANHWRFYYLFALGHAGRLTGRRFIGEHNWYREGAAALCNEAAQINDGSWRGDSSVEADPNIATAFALLFLGEGRRPVVITKLQYDKGVDWNRHRHDVTNLVHHVETKWRKDFPTGLAWQSIDIANTSADDLLESPVLFISGSEAPEIDDKQAAVLREYLDRGGFIFAEACCNGEKFDRGFRELLKKMLPGDEELKPLAAEHRIWSAEQAIPGDKRPKLLGAEHAGRTRVVYSPPREKDQPGLSCLWELSSPGAPKRPDAVTTQIETANAVGLNILSYATGRRLKTRDEFFGRKTETE